VGALPKYALVMAACRPSNPNLLCNACFFYDWCRLYVQVHMCWHKFAVTHFMPWWSQQNAVLTS